MSRLRRIFIDGNKSTLREALEDVLFLSSATQSVRADLLQRTKLQAVKIEVADKNATPDVPDLFTALTRKLCNSRNAHYQQLIVVQYMLLDSELFGRFMLQNEPDSFQQLFMRALKEMNTCFITGHKLDGTPFKAGDKLSLRRSGAFITRVREMFALL